MKKLLQLTIATLLFNCAPAFSKDIPIQVVNQSTHTLYLSANDGITAFPTVIPGNSNAQTVIFQNVTTQTYFEIYFGKFKGDESCTFAYELLHGLSTAECPDLHYQISADYQRIYFK